MTANENGKTNIDDIVEKGLEILDTDIDIQAKREFLSEIKRHGLAVWHALVLYVLRKHPEEAKKILRTTPRRKK